VSAPATAPFLPRDLVSISFSSVEALLKNFGKTVV
jgi:hypothetical protein